jgi:hypothetical protein
MTALDLPDEAFAGIVAFYSIVNIPKEFLPAVFREMARVLQPLALTEARARWGFYTRREDIYPCPADRIREPEDLFESLS